MNINEMKALLNFYVDDTVDGTIAVTLLNLGQNELAIAAKCNFPQLDSNDQNSTFIFTEKYHNLPILYAAARYKGFDSSVREKDSYMNDFVIGLADFTENYTPPAQYRDDFNVQQFTASADGETTYTITKEHYVAGLSVLKVYKNSMIVPFTENTVDGSFTIDSDILTNDAITAVWETQFELHQPPFEFWEGLP